MIRVFNKVILCIFFLSSSVPLLKMPVIDSVAQLNTLLEQWERNDEASADQTDVLSK